MKNKLKNWLISIILLVLWSATSYSQSVNSKVANNVNLETLSQGYDSLYHYLELAAKNNPGIRQQFEEYKAALEKVPQAGSLPDPEFTAGYFLTPMELPMGNQVADLSIMQMFPWFGVLKNGKDEMSLMAQAKLESVRDAGLQLSLDVKRTWYELYRIKQTINVSVRNIEILKVIERLSLSRYRSGSTGVMGSSSGARNAGISGTPGGSGNSGSSMQSMSGAGSKNASSGQSGSMSSGSGMSQGGNMSAGSSMESTTGSGLADLYRIQIETAELENSIALLKDQQRSVLVKFNAYLNRLPLSPVFIPDTLIAGSLSIDSAAIADSILRNNPMLSMLKFEQQALDARQEMNRRMGMPMVGVGLNYSILNQSEMSEAEMNGRDMVMPMVKVTVPIYRKKYKSMQNESFALKSASEQAYALTANNLQTEYFEAMQLYQDARRRVDLYFNQGELAQRSLDIMTGSYSGADLQLTDLLRVRQQLIDYELLQIKAITDLNTAIAWLNRLSGKMQ